MSQFRRKLLESYATNKLVYPGLIAAWSAKGKTNEDADRNVLKDLTGNGHDITLNNFAYSGMSGYGGYVFTKINLDQPLENYERINHYKIRFKKMVTSSYLISFDKTTTPIVKSLKFKVTGITNQILHYGYNREPSNDIIIDKDGIYTTKEVVNPLWYGIYATSIYNDVNITIELLPEYPDALVFDGVDDYHIPIKYSDLGFDKNYTVIGVITPLGESLINRGAFVLSTNDAVSEVDFCRRFESRNIDAGGKRILCYVDTFPTSKKVSYTGNDFYISANNKGENDIVFNIVGQNYLESRSYLAKIAFYSAYIFNKVLDEQEIKSFIRKYIDPEYLLPSETAPTPPPQQGELKYWLCGEDAPVNNKWIDRIDNRMQWELVGSSYNQEGKYYEFGELIKKQAVFNDTNNIFNCGDKFEIEIDFELLPVPDNVPNKAFLLDIGSVIGTNKNFGIDITNNKITTNYKMFGDNTNNKYGIDSTQLNNTTIIKEGRQTIYMGVEKHSDTQNIVYVKDSFGNKVYAPNPHTPINHSNFSIKQYIIGNGLTSGYSFNTVKIYNIKVYVKSYKETMNFIIIPLADAAEVFTSDELEAARKSIDGKEVIVHEEILLQKKVERGLMTLPTDGEPIV